MRINGGPTVDVVVNTPVNTPQPQIQLVQATNVDGEFTMISSWGDLMQENLVRDQLGTGYQTEQLPTTNAAQQVPRPTGPNPSMDSYPGDYGFIVKFHRLSDNIKNKSWDVSSIVLATSYRACHSFTSLQIIVVTIMPIHQGRTTEITTSFLFSFQIS